MITRQRPRERIPRWHHRTSGYKATHPKSLGSSLGTSVPQQYSAGVHLIGDIDGDGVLDVFICQGTDYHVFLNEGTVDSPAFTESASVNPYSLSAIPTDVNSIALVDIDGVTQ